MAKLQSCSKINNAKFTILFHLPQNKYIVMKLNLNSLGIHRTQELSVSTSVVSTCRQIFLTRLDTVIIQNCLESFDVFRDLLADTSYQRKKVVRDVCRNIELKRYGKGDTVYNVGDRVEQLYFCIRGTVSIRIQQQAPQQHFITQIKPTSKNMTPKHKDITKILPIQFTTSPFFTARVNPLQQCQTIQKQMYSVQGGKGFGQQQFISGSKRKHKAVIQSNQSLIGKLPIQNFSQVIQNYKQRIYLRRKDMVKRCCLFSQMKEKEILFIVNNMKPLTLYISNKLIKEGTDVNYLYLVSSGVLSLWKTGIDINQQNNNNYQDKVDKEGKFTFTSRNNNKMNKYQQQQNPSSLLYRSKTQPKSIAKASLLNYKIQKASPIPQQKQTKVFMGQISQGCFIGDMQLAMKIPYEFNAICKTQKAELYCIDKRIIMNKMTQEYINSALKYYGWKLHYFNEKIVRYRMAKQRMQNEKQKNSLVSLTKQKIISHKKKLKLRQQRYTGEIMDGFDFDIRKKSGKNIQKKESRISKQQNDKISFLQLMKKAKTTKNIQRINSYRFFSPISVKHLNNNHTIQYSSMNPQTDHSIQQLNSFQFLAKQPKHLKITPSNLEACRQKQLVNVQKNLKNNQKCDKRLKVMFDAYEKIKLQLK